MVNLFAFRSTDPLALRHVADPIGPVEALRSGTSSKRATKVASRYIGRIKVVAADRMCWPVDPNTLEAVGVSVYDAAVYTDPDPTPIETITDTEWLRRKEVLRNLQRRVRRCT